MKKRHYLEELTLAADQYDKERNYWLEKLSGSLVKSYFPYDYKQVNRNNRKIDYIRFSFTGDDFLKIIEKSKDLDNRIYIILVSGIVALLSRYTGNKDIMVGAPIYKQDVEGNFLNTVLILRNQPDDHMSFKELLMHEVRPTIIEANKNQNYPIEILLEEINSLSSGDDFPLFDAAVLLENIHDREYINNIYPNIIFSFLRTEKCIEGTVEYNSLLYKEDSVKRIIDHYKNVLSGALSDVNRRVSLIEILSEKDKEELIYGFNKEKANYPQDKTIQELFEIQVKNNPHKTAVVSGNTQLSYGELEKMSTQLAGILRLKGINSNSIVGLLLDPSLEMIIGILGILKAGGAYLPMDPHYPSGRVISMMKDTQAAVLLTHSGTITQNHSYTFLQGIQSLNTAIHRTPPRPQIQDLDSLPLVDRSLINYEKYIPYIGLSLVKNVFSVQATRGCPYQCAYCHKIWPKKHVVRSAENIFEEVRLYYNLGVRRFAFVDDIFNLNRENSKRFFELVKQSGLKVQLYFPAGLRGDILTGEYIDLMVEAGTVNVGLALETASPRLQRQIGKNLNIEKLRENITYLCEKYPEVITELFIMHGFPGENEEEAEQTFEFVKDLRWIHFPYLHILKIYPNTDMEKLALENGVSRDAIIESANLAYHELPRTMPFAKSFTLRYQSVFLNEYFLSRDRLLHVLPYQMRILTEDEMVQKYNSYLPIEVKSIFDLLEFLNISGDELRIKEFLAKECETPVGLDKKLRTQFPEKKPSEGGLRVLLLDLSQFFSGKSNMLYDVVEAPLGLLYLLTFLNQKCGDLIDGKIAKSRIDFDNYAELKLLLSEFKPDIIGVRALTFYKDFFHNVIALIRQWGYDVPIIAGGPYATSDYKTLLQDSNVDVAVLGEGEETFLDLITSILENGKKLPGTDVLKTIKGIAFNPGRSRFPGRLTREIIMMDELPGLLEDKLFNDIENINQADDPAYIIYTSGSTGKPKGVMVEHKNVVQLMFNDRYPFDFNNSDTWTMFHSYCFDFSVWEMYGALLYGGRLIIIPTMVSKDPERYLLILKKEKVSVLNQTPRAFYCLIDEELKHEKTNLCLRYIIFGGEALNPIKLTKWKERYPRTKLFNMFGITETTVHVTYKEITDREIELNISNIGKVLPTLSGYVMDGNLNLLPKSVSGELYVGGEGVGRGYLNRVELTNERFLESPFRAGERLYKSGDSVKLLENGEMEYSGRIDRQVKIRGFRIELGEIEDRMLKHDDIREAVVVDVEDESVDRYLCAYFTADNTSTASELREYLARVLPDYMIPSYFMQIDRVPLTPHGKVDRQALPSPHYAGDSEADMIPTGGIEKKLADIWWEVLQSGKRRNGSIGLDSNFFKIGGHSLKAIMLVAKIHKELNVKVPLIELFNFPTIRGLAYYIKKTQKAPFEFIRSVEKKEYYELSSSQKMFYIHMQMEPESTGYNIPLVEILETEVERNKLEETFRQLIDRHEGLRTSFAMVAEGPVQKIHDKVFFAVGYCEDKRGNEKDLIRSFIKPFDLSKAPLLRVKLVKTGDRKKYILLVDLHHIITDGISTELFLRDFIMLYQRKELPGLRLQYKDFSQWQRGRNESEEIKKQEKYWLNEFKGEIPQLNLAVDYSRLSRKSNEAGIVTMNITKEETGKLKELAREIEGTLFMVLLSIVNILLSRICRQEDIVVGTGTAGRRHTDLEGIIGFFVNTLPLRNFPAGEKTFVDFLGEVKQRTIEAFENQDYHFNNLVDKFSIDRSTGGNPLFNVMFALENFGTLSWQSPRVETPELILTPHDYNSQMFQFDLFIIGKEMGEIIALDFEYGIEVFKKETIERFINYTREILTSILESATVKIKDIKISFDLYDQELEIPRIDFGF